MAMSDEQKAAAKKRLADGRAKAAAKRKDDLNAIADVASLTGAPVDTQAKLHAEIADLKAKLAAADAARGDAEKIALAAAEAQGALMQRDIQEVPTGKTVRVQRLDHYKVVGHKDDGREIIKPVFKSVSLPTFFYKIDMPPCGGTDLKINGTPFYHGAVYELDVDSLRTVKDMVFRTWKHDSDIHGSDENFYRKPQQSRLSARGMA